MLLGHIRTRWSNEYLLSLRAFHHFKRKNPRGFEIQAGDVVVVKESGAPRSSWKLAVVEKLIPSSDNEVRGATIRVVNGKGRLTRIRRPLKSLFLLEVNQKEEQGITFDTVCSTDDENCTVSREDDHKEERRPRRKAAINADAIRRILDQ